MTVTSNIPFHQTILLQPKTAPATPALTAPMSRSLWRHTQHEDAAHTGHGWVTRATYCVIGTLGLGSVGYAFWQMCALMSGSHLHDAISAFAR